MLKKRIIPKFLFKFQNIGGKSIPTFVISKKFCNLQTIGSIIPQAKIFEAQLADELVVLNILEKKCSQSSKFLNFLKKFSEQIFMPLTVGGGVDSLFCIETLLNNGADKIFINSGAINNPDLIRQISNRFGSQCIVVGIDFKYSNSEYLVFSKSGKINTKLNLFDWVKRCEDLGSGEILITDIDRDGTSSGLNLEVAKKISTLIDIPLILSGGCGLASHFVDGFKKTKIEAISAATFFANKDQNIFQLRSQILNSGIGLRLP